ncbi:MAG: hypothetical protein COV35_02030 [Alphaproteobacteria bacterium CG11_big_fil_rev_8_21_14_0_20_39_49]|nr:MAG: hypothetical protein COV35_02030 [Alphaproteobacteria bacterium CG11_big_fil_rev_8_21_14_0_20_39_49]
MIKNNMYKKVVILSVVLFSCSGFFNIFNSGWKSYIPQELKPTKVIYEVDGTHAFGPGGINEAFIVYSLSNDLADKIKSEGLPYLENMPSTVMYEKLHASYENLLANGNLAPEKERKERFAFLKATGGQYKDWQATPVPDDEERWNRNRNKYYKQWVREGVPVEERWERYRGKYRGHDTLCKDISLCSFYGDLTQIPTSFKSSNVLKNKTLEELNFTDEIKSEYIELLENIIKSPNNYYSYGEFGVFVVSPQNKKAFLLYRD